MSPDRFLQLLSRMAASRVASSADLVGCSEAEIAALEARYQLRLPRSYRRYLEVMGYRSGRLFTSDHMAVFYPYVLSMTAEDPQEWAAEGCVPPPGFVLPEDALLIAGRLGEQYQFIRCTGEDESPVWYFNTYEWEIQSSHPSVLSWLETWCGEAERAIASGYFDRYPNGTTP